MTQDTLEGLCLLAGLGTPWAPPGGAGGGVWGKGRLGVSAESAESAAPTTQTWINRKKTSTKEKTGQFIKLRGENDHLFTGTENSATMAW
ncbi:hypothetical protein AMECASPLE_018248, partial [Ameca splendens]